ncbi:hypothetical protein KEH51_01770 [[Brevibacterium] frigoritolerans]|uniref:Uncharacterized protein n=1 Tax=Peribacillus frigoritolerans TaxID=450367 RepID=A0A941FPR3_9BACI|nr:hypothetical protein [Peribacillus frigoritolerans]
MDKLAECYASIELMGDYDNGKKKIVKIASATIMAATTIVAVAPAPSDAATSLNSKIKTAKAAIKNHSIPISTLLNSLQCPLLKNKSSLQNKQKRHQLYH